MSTNFKQRTLSCELHGETTWQDLYTSLRPLAKRMVYAFRVPAWLGQENDIAEDIVQETARKLIERMRKADRKEALPIYALKPMVRVIAYNYGKDMRRHDQRVSRIPEQDDFVEQQNVLDEVANTEEALLIDLAAHMSFERQPTPLQKAFLKAGMQLQEYRHMLPATNEERNKYTSLLAHAYRRISTLSCAQAYAAAESG